MTSCPINYKLYERDLKFVDSILQKRGTDASPYENARLEVARLTVELEYAETRQCEASSAKDFMFWGAYCFYRSPKVMDEIKKEFAQYSSSTTDKTDEI